MTVDLDGEQPDDGEANERDTVGTDVEGVIGGSGDDVITGSAGDDSLYGGDGDDRIVDTGGEDLLDGADGDDVLLAADGEADSVECGLGEDEARVRRDRRAERRVRAAVRPGADTDGDADAHTADDASDRAAAGTHTAAGPRRPGGPDGDGPRRLCVRARTMRARGVTVTLTCDEICRASFELKAVTATARRWSAAVSRARAA